MAFDENYVRLLGNLGKAPEINPMRNGKDVGKFQVATSDRWKDRQTGEWQKRTEWHRVVVFNEQAMEHVVPRLDTGDRVVVEGKLVTNKWQDKQTGQDRYTTEIQVTQFSGRVLKIDMGSGGGGGNGYGNGGGYPQAGPQQEPDPEPTVSFNPDEDDDEEPVF